MRIIVDDLSHAAVHSLLTEHLMDMFATSPAESVHALDLSGLQAPDVTVWSAWDSDTLLGIGALRELDPFHGEIKSMRTPTSQRGRGVGSAMLTHLIDQAQARGYTRLSLETGSQEFFAPARRLYARHAFTECGPFGDYVPDLNSHFMTRVL